MVNKTKLSWGIGGLLVCVIVTDLAFRSLNEGMRLLAIAFFIGAIIGAVMSIIEIIQSVRNK